MATKPRTKEEMAQGLGRYYESERDDLWGRVNRDAAVNGMSELTDPSQTKVKSVLGGAGTTDVVSSGGSIGSVGSFGSSGSGGGGGSNFTARTGDSDGETYSGGLGLGNIASSLVGAGAGLGLGMAGVPFGGTFGSIFGGLLSDKSAAQVGESAVNGVVGSLVGMANPVAGLIYSIAKAAGLNIGQGLNEQFGNGMTGIAPGFGGGYTGKKGTGDGITGTMVAADPGSVVTNAMTPFNDTAELGNGLTLGPAVGLEAGVFGLQQSYDPAPAPEAAPTPVTSSITDSLAQSALNMANAVKGGTVTTLSGGTISGGRFVAAGEYSPTADDGDTVGTGTFGGVPSGFATGDGPATSMSEGSSFGDSSYSYGYGSYGSSSDSSSDGGDSSSSTSSSGGD